MKCILHIGGKKTATTTLQTFFSLNRIKLLENGFIYTSSTGDINNQALSVAAYNLHRRDDFTLRMGLNSDRKLKRFQNQTILNLKKEITTHLTQNPNLSLLFSSEHLQSRLIKTEEISRLKDILTSLGVNNISVIVYLRRPAEIANSLYSTQIKLGMTHTLPSSPSDPYLFNLCNHRNTLQRFRSVFGSSAVHPRLFDKDAFIGRSIINDFLNLIGIRPDQSFTLPKIENESLSSTGVNLLRRVNQSVPMWINEKPNPKRANLASYFEKHLSDRKYMMPAQLYKEYDSAFKDSNEWVRRNYFPDRECLFSQTIHTEISQKTSEVDLDHISDLIAHIWNDKQAR